MYALLNLAFSDSLKHECHIPMFEFSLAIYMSSNTSYRVHCNIAVHSTCNHIQSIPGCPFFPCNGLGTRLSSGNNIYRYYVYVHGNMHVHMHIHMIFFLCMHTAN